MYSFSVQIMQKIQKKQAKIVTHLFSKHAKHQRYDEENHTKLPAAQ